MIFLNLMLEQKQLGNTLDNYLRQVVRPEVFIVKRMSEKEASPSENTAIFSLNKQAGIRKHFGSVFSGVRISQHSEEFVNDYTVIILT